MDEPRVYHPTDRPNFTEVVVGPVELTFSYRTVIAFTGPGEPRRVVSENCWSTTTGKHLNYVDGGDKKSRVPRAEFEARLAAMLARLELATVEVDA